VNLPYACLSVVLQRLLLAVWTGALCASGLMAAPILFHVLPDRSLAGTVAGELFAVTAWLGLVCGPLLLVLNWLQVRRADWRFWCLVLMLALVWVGHFLLAPLIAQLRVAGLVDSARFGQLHGLAGVLYLVTVLAGLVLVGAGPAGRDHSCRSRKISAT
jgi:hypothetical protein